MRTHALARLFAVAVVLAISASAHSQITTNEKPYSFSATGTRNAPNPVLLDPPDMKKVNAEDAVNDTATNAPIRAAVPIDVNINSEFDGQWEDLPDGGSLWRMTIIASGAQALNIVYDRFWLPDGGKFFVYGSDNDGVVGAVTSEFLHGSMKEPAPFATRPTNGETVTMEYYATENVTAKPTISVSSIYYGYRYMRSNEPDSKGLGDSGSC